MNETALVFDRDGKTLFWHEPEGRTAGSIPDTDILWDVLWENRSHLGGVAHTHPWDGPARASAIDLRTFNAVERALGRRLLWPIVTFNRVAYLHWRAVRKDYVPFSPKITILDIEELRRRSR